MKHRSVITFILLAAALVAAPQISQDLSSFKRALGARIHGEILRTFLNLPVRQGANDFASQRAGVQVASCKSQEIAAPQVATPFKKLERSSPSADVVEQSDSHAQLASLDKRSNASASVASKAELVGDAHGFKAVEAEEIAQRARAEGELAMLVPPGTGVDVPGLADARMNDTRAKASARREKSGEARRRALFIASSFEKAGVRKAGEEFLQRMGSSWASTELLRATENGARVKFLKQRRAPRAADGKNAAFAPRPVAALLPPDSSLHGAPKASEDED